MTQNPLIIPILEILKSTQENISEYDLIYKLEQEGIEYQVKNESYDMTMFKKKIHGVRNSWGQAWMPLT